MSQISSDLLDSLLETYRLAVRQDHPIAGYLLEVFKKAGIINNSADPENSLDLGLDCGTIQESRNRSDEDDDGRWITTENGHRVHLNGEGEPDKGNPHVVGAMTHGSGGEAAKPSSFGGQTSAAFSKAVKTAKENMAKTRPEVSWRVTAHTQEELDKEYPGAKLHTTPGGSTAAVTTDGDIISICKNPTDTVRGKDLIAMAVANGGKKLDSYSGNHAFYVKCGFEPVSWCQWDDQYAPDDWDLSKGCKREPVVFYKYTGNTSQYKTADDFFNAVPASEDYDTAMKTRDDTL